MLNLKVFSICIFCLFLFVLLFLDKCTSRNISTMFNSTEFYKYPELVENPVSASYQIRRISPSIYGQLSYEPVHQFFMVTTADTILKLDAQGKELYHLKTRNINVERYTPYVMDSTGIYDFSEKNLRHQAIKEVINADQKLNPEVWQNRFDELYKAAEVVVYGTNSFYGDFFYPIYFKVKQDWLVLIMLQHDERWDDFDQVSGVTFKGYPAKYSALYLLKDQENGLYSNLEGTTDSYLKTYYTVKIKESSLKYTASQGPQITSFKKDGVESYAAYISLPVTWSIKAGYEWNVGQEKIYFKGDAIQDVGFSKPIETFLRTFRVPEKFSKQTSLTFLRYSFPSNGPQSLNNGLYILSKK
jgi:hypothetical protein